MQGHLLNPLFCDIFAAVVLCIMFLLLWYIKSHGVDISVFCLLLYLRFKVIEKFQTKNCCAFRRFPHWKSLYHSTREISGTDSHRNFWLNGKRLKTRALIIMIVIINRVRRFDGFL